MTEEKKDFIIKDRRIFAEENQDQKDGDQQEEIPDETAAEPSGTQDSEETTTAKAEEGEPDTTPLPEINFSTFIFSLNASALVHLGAIEDPASGQKVKNLPLAKQTIDILNMLEEKTQGNLNKDEESIMRNILYDLRIAYVKETG